MTRHGTFYCFENFACLNQPTAAVINEYQSHSTGEAHIKGSVHDETGNS